MKIRPVGAELFHADEWTDRQRQTDRQTDMAKLTVACRSFAYATDYYKKKIKFVK